MSHHMLASRCKEQHCMLRPGVFWGSLFALKNRKHPSPGLVVNIELVGAKFIFPRVVLVMEELQESFL